MSRFPAAEDAERCTSCFELTFDESACRACGWDGTRDSSDEGTLAPGTILRDDFMLGRTLGQGGFGITYLAWDLRLNRRRAIKEYFPRGVATRGKNGTQVSLISGQTELYTEGIQRYLDEARLLAQFETHDCIVSPLTFFELNGTAYLVMEYLEGETLRSYVMRQGGKIPYPHALHFLYPVIDALGAIHRAGITHRDVTPDNVFLTVDGKTKLIDFGAARQQLATQRARMTVIVREHYAPPEQYSRSGRQGPWTDVYALCSTLYFSVTGQPPPPAMDRYERDEIIPPRELGADIPEVAQAALLRGLALRTWERVDLPELALALLERAADPALVAGDPLYPGIEALEPRTEPAQARSWLGRLWRRDAPAPSPPQDQVGLVAISERDHPETEAAALRARALAAWSDGTSEAAGAPPAPAQVQEAESPIAAPSLPEIRLPELKPAAYEPGPVVNESAVNKPAVNKPDANTGWERLISASDARVAGRPASSNEAVARTAEPLDAAPRSDAVTWDPAPASASETNAPHVTSLQRTLVWTSVPLVVAAVLAGVWRLEQSKRDTAAPEPTPLAEATSSGQPREWPVLPAVAATLRVDADVEPPPAAAAQFALHCDGWAPALAGGASVPSQPEVLPLRSEWRLGWCSVVTALGPLPAMIAPRSLDAPARGPVVAAALPGAASSEPAPAESVARAAEPRAPAMPVAASGSATGSSPTAAPPEASARPTRATEPSAAPRARSTTVRPPTPDAPPSRSSGPATPATGASGSMTEPMGVQDAKPGMDPDPDDPSQVRPGREAVERYEAALGRIRVDDRQGAVELLRQSATGGYVPAMARLGRAFAFGELGAPDDITALRWYRYAANRGDAESQYALGLRLELGAWQRLDVGRAPNPPFVRDRWLVRNYIDEINRQLNEEPSVASPDDLAKAARWYRLAAEQGDARAQLRLGYLCWGGRGVAANRVEAFAWFQKAAESGSATGQLLVGVGSWLGEGTTQDRVAGRQWIDLAAAQGSELARRVKSDMIQATAAERRAR